MNGVFLVTGLLHESPGSIYHSHILWSKSHAQLLVNSFVYDRNEKLCLEYCNCCIPKLYWDISDFLKRSERCSAWNSVTFQSRDVPSPTNLQAAGESKKYTLQTRVSLLHPPEWFSNLIERNGSVESFTIFSDKQKQSGSLDPRGDDFCNKSTALIRSSVHYAHTNAQGEAAPGSSLISAPSPQCWEKQGGIDLEKSTCNQQNPGKIHFQTFQRLLPFLPTQRSICTFFFFFF